MSRPTISGIILAGGKGRRMGGIDKGLVDYKGMPLVTYAIRTLQPQVDELLINANRNIDKYAKFGLSVIPDQLPDFSGPLAGMHASLLRTTTEYAAFIPCDTPNLPSNLVDRLFNSLQQSGAQASFAHDGNRAHPVIALLNNRLHESLLEYLNSGQRKVMNWFEQERATHVDFSDTPAAFMNINYIDKNDT